MTQPGDLLLSGQLNGRALGNALFNLAPSLPHESPLPLPRTVAKMLFPNGWLSKVQPAPARYQPAAPPVQPAPPIPPAGIPVTPPAQPARMDAKGNAIQHTQTMPQRAIRQGAGVIDHDPGMPHTVVIRAQERRGLL